MAAEQEKDPLKEVDWRAVGVELQKDPSSGSKQAVKKRLPKRIRQIPDYYFLPRMSKLNAFAFYGACIAGGIGAGMLLEIYINKKVKGVSRVLLKCLLNDLVRMLHRLRNRANRFYQTMLTVVILFTQCAQTGGKEEIEFEIKLNVWNTNQILRFQGAYVTWYTSIIDLSDGYKIIVVPGKTYKLRLIIAALNMDNFFSIANHKLTTVEANADQPVRKYSMAIGTYMSAQNVIFQNVTLLIFSIKEQQQQITKLQYYQYLTDSFVANTVMDGLKTKKPQQQF
ncbi:hypothetical protein ACFE04_018980 [Oxalis oulophora]